MNLLGKLEAQRDDRNLKLKRLLKPVLPPIPDAYDCDTGLNASFPSRKWGNDLWSCCVVAARANQTLRFEQFEQKRVLNILDSQILNEYWEEQGGNSKTRPDNGLYALNSLKLWRSRGWLTNRRYTIYAFAEVDRRDQDEVKAGIYLLNGLQGGLLLPKSAEKEFDSKAPWMTCTDAPGSWGGHMIYFVGFSKVGPTCLTWGRKQLMSWDFFSKYCDEAYGVVDNRDKFLKDSPVDVDRLDKFLKAVTA